MSYTPGSKQLQKLISGLKKVPFFEWASRPAGFHFWEINQTGYYNYYEEYIGSRFKYVFILSKGNYQVMYRNQEQHQSFIDNLQKKVKNYQFLSGVERKISNSYKEIWGLAKSIKKTNWSKVSNKTLAIVYLKYHDQYAHWFSGISTSILIAESMAKDLKNTLEFHAEKHNIKDNVDLAVRILSTPDKLSMTALEEYELLKIRNTIKQSEQIKALKHHEKKWSYIPVYSHFEPWSLEDFENRLKSFSSLESKKRYLELKNHKVNTTKSKEEIFKKFKCDDHTKRISDLLSKYIYWRINDETTIGLVTRERKNFMKEIARRLNISLRQLEHVSSREVADALTKDNIDLDLINERINGYAIILNPQGVAVVSGGSLKTVLKNTKLVVKEKPSLKSKKWRGTPANPGLTKGTVKIILDPSLNSKIRKGDILVTTNTTPAYVVAMKLSNAIITEEGGITSHAAIVSRELGIPCVIGVPGITKILKDGDKVEVDATQGIVRKI